MSLSPHKIQFHYCVSGFLQSEGRWNGLLKLKDDLIKEIGCGLNRQIHYFKWWANWKDIAEYCFLVKDYYEADLEVYVYGYSYGGGWGASQLCKYLDRANIRVPHVVLSDAVFRHPLLLMRWTALINGQKIRFPGNVEKIDWFYQTKNVPSGHTPVSPRAGVVNPGVRLNYEHNKMDDAIEFRRFCLEVARKSAG